MFRIKICGITSPADAFLAAEAGADAIGLNFYRGSKRYCPPEQAAEIARAVSRRVCRVGVFVNASPGEIRAIHDSTPLDLIQLHGDEPPELLRELRPLPIVRAVRVATDLAAVAAELETCYRLQALPRMLLVDAAQAGQFGGTGHTLDWQALSGQRAMLRGLPLVLAGGLKPDNVRQAILAVRPWAVDVASGVESAPGRKSTELVQQFVAEAQAAFTQLSRLR